MTNTHHIYTWIIYYHIIFKNNNHRPTRVRCTVFTSDFICTGWKEGIYTRKYTYYVSKCFSHFFFFSLFEIRKKSKYYAPNAQNLKNTNSVMILWWSLADLTPSANNNHWSYYTLDWKGTSRKTYFIHWNFEDNIRDEWWK